MIAEVRAGTVAAAGPRARRRTASRPGRACYPRAVISRAADPRTVDRIVYELLRTPPGGGDPAVIGSATYAVGATSIEADTEVETALRELLARPFVDRVQADERPRGYRRSQQGQVDLLVPGMPEHFIARMRGLWLSYPDGSVVTARELGSVSPAALLVAPESVETTPAVVDPTTRLATLAVSDQTVGARPLVRAHPPIEGDRPGAAPHRTDCGWLT